MQKKICPKCYSSNIKTIEGEFGKCLECGAKFVLDDMPKIKCPKCKSEDIRLIEDFGKCKICGTKFVIEDVLKKQKKKATSKQELENDEKKEKSNAKKKDLLTIRCDKCGSTDVDVVSEDMAVCQHCKSKIIINAGKKKITKVTNNVKIVSKGGNDCLSSYAIERTLKSEDFFRGAIIDVYSRKNVPIEFIDRDFMPVKSDYEDYFSANYDVNLSYSATIGYDRIEQYQEWNDSTKKYETKKRTVTDWQPFSGNAFENKTITLQGGENLDTGLAFERQLLCENINICDYDTADFEKGEKILPSQSNLDISKSLAISSVGDACERNLPGDRHRDYNYHGNASLNDIKTYSAPIYNFSYKNEDKDYTISGFGFGSVRAYGDQENEEGKIYAQLNKMTKPFFAITLSTIILSILLTILFGLVMSFKVLYLGFAGLTGILSIIFIIVFGKKKKKLYIERQLEKLKRLKEFIDIKNFTGLNEYEEGLFLISTKKRTKENA